PSPRPVPSGRAPRAYLPSRGGEICACGFLSSTPFSFGTPAGAPRFPHGLDREDDLAELLARLEPLVGGADLLPRQYRLDDRQRAAAGHELVGASEILAGAHRGTEDRELLPPDPMQRRGRVRAGRRAADGDPTSRSRNLERGRPRRLADVLNHDVDAVALGRLLHRRLHVAGRVVHARVGAELARTL